MKSILFILAIALSFSSYAQHWTQKAPIPSHIGAEGMISFSINGKIYAGGGYTGTARIATFYEYYPATDMWTRKADIPDSLNSAGFFVLNGKGYMCCGINTGGLSRHVYAYDPLTDTWQTKNDFPGAIREAVGSFCWHGKGYLCGGFVGGGQCSSEMWRYNDSTDIWSPLLSIPGPGRNGVFHFIINDHVYLGLGADANGSAWYSDMYHFNPDSGTYTPIASLPTPNGGCVNFAMGKVGYIGLGYDGAHYISSIYKYHPGSNSWTLTDSFDAGPRFVSFCEVAAGRPYIGCGMNAASVCQYDLWTWDCTKPIISRHGDTLFSSLNGSCHWYRNDTLISGADTSFFVSHINGNYTVQASDSNSCLSLSTPFTFTKSDVNDISEASSVFIYPNPASGVFMLQARNQHVGSVYWLSDLAGRVILSGKIEKEYTQLDIKYVSAGTYIVHLDGRSYRVIKE